MSRQPIELQLLESRRLFAVAGTLDKSFSADGKDIIALNITPGRSFFARDVAVQSDGKTVVVGDHTFELVLAPSDIAVARYNMNGTLDTTFGGPAKPGVAIFHIGKSGSTDHANAVAIQPDGKIVVAGTTTLDRNLATDTDDFAVIRLNSNGTLDKTFSGDGKQVIQFNDSSEVNDILIQPDGKILLGGYNSRVNLAVTDEDDDFAIARLKSDGSMDTTFSGDGKLAVGFGKDDRAVAMRLDSSGNIILVGTYDRFGPDESIAILKLKPNGDGDTNFGTNARVIFKISGLSLSDEADLLIQPDKKIVVSASSTRSNNGALFRFGPTGKLDTTFGGQGTGRVSVTGMKNVTTLLPTSDGGFIAGGGASGKYVLTAYSANGSLSTGFGVGGRVETSFGDSDGFIGGMARGPGKRFVIAGGKKAHVARYLEAGANTVSLGALDGAATEGTTDNGSIIVGRTERLSVPTRVFINVSGTAKAPGGLVATSFDYTVKGLVFPSNNNNPPRAGEPPRGAGESLPFVDIPAGETFVILPLIPKDDTTVEGRETALFTIASSATYEIGTPAKAEIDINDTDSGILVNLNGVTDSFVRDGDSANTNFSSSPELQAKTGGTGFTRFSYIKFDISTLSTVSSAKLNLFGKLVDTQSANVGVSVFPVADNTWTGPGITFNNRPAPGNTALASVSVVGTTAKNYEFDVSNYVKQEKTLGRTFVSFFISAPTAAASLVSFNSGNAASNTPKLAVLSVLDTVGAATVSPAPIPSVAKVGQQLQIAVKWDVPSGGWRQLSWIKLALRDEENDSLAVLKFEEATNSFYLATQPGVTDSPVTLVKEKSSFKATSASSPTVTATYTFKFNASAAGRKYVVETAARNDKKEISGLSAVGIILVKR